MQILDEAIFRDFWYPVAPLARLAAGPAQVTVLGQPLAVWMTPDGRPAAVEDRCSHRRAALSLGVVREGALHCPYHGWAFDGAGHCVHRPQLPTATVPSNCHIRGFACTARYGHVWVCLGTARTEIPIFPEEDDPTFRRIACFCEVWNTSAARVMENELDMAHFPYVHTGTFGDAASPRPVRVAVSDRGPYELGVEAELQVVADSLQAANTGMGAGKSSRTMEIRWYMPFTVRLEIRYANGLRHVIINNATPVADDRALIVQFHYRNDREEDVPEAQLIRGERRIVDEDRRVLEGCDPVLDLDPKHEAHLPTDQAGLLMRRKLRALLGGELSSRGTS